MASLRSAAPSMGRSLEAAIRRGHMFVVRRWTFAVGRSSLSSFLDQQPTTNYTIFFTLSNQRMVDSRRAARARPRSMPSSMMRSMTFAYFISEASHTLGNIEPGVLPGRVLISLT